MAFWLDPSTSKGLSSASEPSTFKGWSSSPQPSTSKGLSSAPEPSTFKGWSSSPQPSTSKEWSSWQEPSTSKGWSSSPQPSTFKELSSWHEPSTSKGSSSWREPSTSKEWSSWREPSTSKEWCSWREPSTSKEWCSWREPSTSIEWSSWREPSTSNEWSSWQEPSTSKVRSPLDVGSELWVLVTHINNPHHFYVRLLEKCDHLDIVEETDGPIELIPTNFRSTVIYPSRLLKKNIRGKVYNMQHHLEYTECDIFAIDYGFTEKGISSHELMKPKIVVPPFAIRCRLAYCSPVGLEWTPESIEAMKCFCPDNERTKMTVIDKNQDCLCVDLINSCPDNISAMLAYSGHSSLGMLSNAVNKIDVPAPVIQHYIHKKPTLYTDMLVRLQYGNVMDIFFVTTPTQYYEYVTRRSILTAQMKNQSPLKKKDIVEGALVAARVDNTFQYERALIVAVAKTKALVQLVDWGSIEEILFENLKPIPESFIKEPVIALCCCLDKRSTLPDSMLRNDLAPGYEFKILVTKLGKAFFEPHIVAYIST